MQLIARLDSGHDPEQAVGAVRHWLTEEGGRLRTTEGAAVESEFGSRLGFRLWGVFGPGPKYLPFRLRAEAERSDTGSILTITMTEDAGWYVYRTFLAEAEYRERMSCIVGALKARGVGVAHDH